MANSLGKSWAGVRTHVGDALGRSWAGARRAHVAGAGQGLRGSMWPLYWAGARRAHVVDALGRSWARTMALLARPQMCLLSLLHFIILPTIPQQCHGRSLPPARTLLLTLCCPHQCPGPAGDARHLNEGPGCLGKDT